MEYLFFLGLLVFFIILSNRAHKRAEKLLEKVMQDPADRNCPPHKWSHHPVNNKLTCTLCNLEPGQVKTENGEY